MTGSQTNMAVDYSLALPFWLVTKDSMIIELVYVNLTVRKVNFFGQGGGGGPSRGWALNQNKYSIYFWSKEKH